MAALPGFPLLRRELIGLLRTRKAFWLLLVTVPLAGLLPLLSWPSGHGSPGETREAFLVFMVSQLALALVAVPALTAGAIAGERERETYDLLHMTFLSQSSIVLSKALASVGYLLVLVAASAPSLAVLSLLGGLELHTVLECYAVTFAALAASALVSLGQSARCRRTSHAAVRAIIAVAFWNGGLLLLLCFLVEVVAAASGHRIFPSYDVKVFGLALSPFTTMAFEVLDRTPWRSPGLIGMPLWLTDCAYAGLVFIAQGLLLLWRQPRLARGRGWRWAGAERRIALNRVSSSLSARLFLLLGSAGFLRNPLFLKEVRSEFFARPWFRRTVFWGSGLILAGVAYASRDLFDAVEANLWVTLCLLTILVPGVVATSFSRETREGSLDLIRGTLLTPEEVLAGKLLGGVYSCAGILLSFVLASGAALFLHDQRGGSFQPTPGHLWLAGLPAMTLALLFTSALSIFASVLSRRSLGALLLAYLGTGAVYFVYPLLATRAISLAGYGQSSFPSSICASFHPIWAVVTMSDKEMEMALPGFFCVYTGAILLLWLLSRLRLRRRWALDA